MTLRKLRDFILDSERDLHERLFVLIMSVTVFSWIITLIEIIIAGAETFIVLALLGGTILLSAVSVISIRLNKIKIGSIIISIGVCFVYIPITFIFGGGLNGDGPLWFMYGIIFMNMCLSKRIRIALLCLYVILLKFLWTFDIRHPDLIVQNAIEDAHRYSFIAMILIGIMISLVLGCWTFLYNREVERSKHQKQEIEALNKAQNSFFSSMSHEIRTPINTIIGLNEMILKENISDEVAEDAVNIQSASKLLLSLINDILDMSKFASGQMELMPVTYNPGEMLSELVGMLWLKAKEKGLEFKVDVSPDIPAQLIGDEVRIQQILINILNNAIKYTKEGSVVFSIQSSPVENGSTNMIYTVTDTGIGIKKENMPFLFTAFKRVDETKNRHIEGTGLGLSIVKQFVDLMNGKITVNSVYTKGSTFVVEIPQKVAGEGLVGQIDLESNNTKAKKQLAKSTGFEAPDANVLIVDDNEANLLVISKQLRNTKAQVETATSGEEALRKTMNKFYNVIFMDHLMPEMDGIECFNAIKSQTGGMCKESKVVALTANVSPDTMQYYMAEGFDGYISKPATRQDIEKELYRLLPKDMIYVSGEGEQILEETVSWMKIDRKKKNVMITTESVADLPKEIIEKYGIAILPHLVVTEEGSFLDGVEIETNGVLDYMTTGKKLKTKAPEISDIELFFAKHLSNANNIVHISISDQLTNSGCRAAKEAAKAFDNVTVIDSGHLSSGQGLIVIEACRLAEKGMSPAEIVNRIEKLKNIVHSNFIVDNLDFLAKADQVKMSTANFAKSIMVRPVLKMKNGKMKIGSFYFGSRERAWRKYIESVLRCPSNIDKRICFVTYVGLSNTDMNWIREQIDKRIKFEEIYFQKACPVIAVNCGPGTFGLLTRDAAKI